MSEAHWNIERECTINLRNSRELLHRHPYLSGVQLIVYRSFLLVGVEWQQMGICLMSEAFYAHVAQVSSVVSRNGSHTSCILR